MTFRKMRSVRGFCDFTLAAVLALTLAGCGGGNGGGAPAGESLSDARRRAQVAFDAVREAFRIAQEALTGIQEADDVRNYTRAKDAADAVETALEAARAANDRAQAATTAVDALRAVDDLVAELGKAERASRDAVRFADMVRQTRDMRSLRTKNARLFESANGDDEDTDAAKRRRVGMVEVLVADAGGAGRIEHSAWDITPQESADDVTTETRGTSLAGAAGVLPAAARVTWGADTGSGGPAERRFRVRIDTDGGAATVLSTENAAGAIPTNEQRPLPRIDDWSGFHGVELSSIDGGLYAHAYTDISQTRVIPAQNAASVRNAPVRLDRIPDSVVLTPANQAAGSFMGDYDHDGDPDSNPLHGTFSCGTGQQCTLDIDGAGRITAISGYAFTGSGPAQPQREAPDEDYLVFGIWLNSPAVLPSVGAFASGNRSFEVGAGGTDLQALEGNAQYRGPATGIHTMGGVVRPFDATATLTASFGDGSAAGTVSGAIENIVSGGTPVPDSIILIEAELLGYTDAESGHFRGAARMGAAEDPAATTPVYPYNGGWGGRFYGPGAPGAAAMRYPGSAAGIFGVSGTEDGARQSFVGAFGAHRQP